METSTVSAVAGEGSCPVDYLVHDPLCSGFLLKFCKEQYSDENMLFLIAVDRFRDYCYRDTVAWTKECWKQLDLQCNTCTSPETDSPYEFAMALKGSDFFSEEKWPSRIVNKDILREYIYQIWQQFLKKNADKWICISQSILINTMRRIQLLPIYGPEVFAEAMIDPMQTIKNDIYPRFTQSPIHRKMIETLESIRRKAHCDRFRLSSPRPILWDRYPKADLLQHRIRFTLNDMIEDALLYPEFMKYTESRLIDENLKCLRAVTIYKESFEAWPGKKTPLDNALLIYRHFISPSSPYQVSTSSLVKNDILRGLAEPYITLFDAVERLAMEALASHFRHYQTTPEYEALPHLVSAHMKLVANNNGEPNSHTNNNNNNNNNNQNNILKYSSSMKAVSFDSRDNEDLQNPRVLNKNQRYSLFFSSCFPVNNGK
jgi:hypothetical protein